MGLIIRSYTYLDKNSFPYLLNALVRPYLEYCVSICYPRLKKDEELIKNLLCHVSKLIPRVSNFPYDDCLCAIDKPSMKYHQIRFDMIQVYKILHGEDKSLKRLFSVERNHLIKIKYVNISLV